MNRVFEEFFFKLVKEYYPLPSKEQVPEVSWRSKLGQTFTNKPDILIYDEIRKNIEYIIDTKYKTEITQSDIRQLFDYMEQKGRNEAYAILPKTENSKPDEYNSAQEHRDSTIKVRYIDIDKAIDLIYLKDSKTRKEEILTMLKGILQ